VFDEQPPFAEIGYAIGFDSSQGDLAGRFGYLKLSKGF
jgi:iron complex outermembrane recepter protein